jgi:hypothetical protein
VIKEKYLSYVHNHRWAVLLKHQSSITGLPFADQGKQTSVFRLQQTNGSLRFSFYFSNKQTEIAIFLKFCFPFG